MPLTLLFFYWALLLFWLLWVDEDPFGTIKLVNASKFASWVVLVFYGFDTVEVVLVLKEGLANASPHISIFDEEVVADCFLLIVDDVDGLVWVNTANSSLILLLLLLILWLLLMVLDWSWGLASIAVSWLVIKLTFYF